MGKLADDLKKEMARNNEHSKEFSDQLERNRQFKEKMRQAGVEYGDKFSIPLMSRLGHTVRSK